MPGSDSGRDGALGTAGRTFFAAALLTIVVVGAVLSVRYGHVVTPLIGALR